MRRSLTYSALWVVAAGLATSAAWQGVGLVTHQVTDDRPDALAAADVQAKLDEADRADPADPGPGPGDAGDPAATTTVPPTSADTTTTAPATPAGVTRTYTAEGGSATLRFTPAGVTVVMSTPEAGFGVETEPEHGNGVRVEFESDTHRSRIEGWWDGGPQERVREQPR